jgi:hypothetical protein
MVTGNSVTNNFDFGSSDESSTIADNVALEITIGSNTARNQLLRNVVGGGSNGKAIVIGDGRENDNFIDNNIGDYLADLGGGPPGTTGGNNTAYNNTVSGVLKFWSSTGTTAVSDNAVYSNDLSAGGDIIIDGNSGKQVHHNVLATTGGISIDSTYASTDISGHTTDVHVG